MDRDSLTGCFLKKDIISSLYQAKASADEKKTPFSLLVIDLDKFKAYNDTYGHVVGDDILKFFANVLHTCLPQPYNLSFRFGGDEFVVILNGKNAEEAMSLSMRTKNILMEKIFVHKEHTLKLNFSAGIATYPRDCKNPDEILAKADQALYISKRLGRGRITRFDKIGVERFKRILHWLMLLVAAAILVVTSFKGKAYLSKLKQYLETSLPNPQKKQQQAVKQNSLERKRVYLKNGSFLEGIIVQDDGREIKLNIATGEGKAIDTVSKEDIQKIE